MNMNDDATQDDATESSSSLDYALLESLFYNEMIKMNESSSLFPQSLLLSDDSSEEITSSAADESLVAATDPLTAAEQALLRDFGVDSSPTVATCAIITEAHHANTTEASCYTPALQEPVADTAADMKVSSESSQQQRNKLLAQFTTLASRLGIDLSPQVLQSLTASSTTKMDGVGLSVKPATANNSLPAGAAADDELKDEEAALSTPDGYVSNHSAAKLGSVETAAAALVLPSSSSEKRSATAKEIDAKLPPVSSFGVTSGAVAAAKSGSPSGPRKKPRLEACDQKLAQLQEENAILQSRVQALSAKHHQSSKERQELEIKLKRFLLHKTSGVTDGESAIADKEHAEMQQVIDQYQELYSDYGRRRDQELLIHLQQLQRLANPTNVTKMGLWTLGQGPDRKSSTAEDLRRPPPRSSNNPIVGLLQRELGITATQSKKILEQREKIRQVCANLREVRLLVMLERHVRCIRS
jgi:hypothetical protein